MLIKKKRIQLGLTQSQLAKEIGVGTQFISNIERGLCELPLKHYHRAAKILRLEVSKMLDERMEKMRLKLNKVFGVK